MKQPDDKMRELGFTDSLRLPDMWRYCSRLYKKDSKGFKDSGVCLIVRIEKETWEYDITVWDDNFGYPIPQFNDIKTPYFDNVRANYKKEIARLVDAGVLEEECHT